MLQNEFEPIDWKLSINKAIDNLSNDLKPFLLKDFSITKLNFPIEKYPTKVRSLNFSKSASYEGVLSGIKGQYLIFEDETVCNIRSNEGTEVLITVN